MITKLVIGLGNPGEEYKNNRHNVGFIMLDKIAQNLSVNFDNNKKKSLYGRAKKNDIEYILLKPLTYMNLSGESASYITKFFNINVEDIIVIYDDMDIPFGSFKIKKGGSSGGEGFDLEIGSGSFIDGFDNVMLHGAPEKVLRNEEDCLLRDVVLLHVGFLLKNRNPRLDVGLCDVYRKSALEARFEPLFQRRELTRMTVGRENDLFAELIEVVEGVEERLLASRLAGKKLDVVHHQHVDSAVLRPEFEGEIAVLERVDIVVDELF